MAALPPYGCGVPFTGVERLVQENSTAGGHWCTTAPPDVSLRGAKRRGNLAVLGRITGRSRRKRSCLPEIATAPSGPRNDKSEGIAPLNLCRDHCQPARRSLTAATDAIGAHRFNVTRYELQLPPRDRHVREARVASALSPYNILSKKSKIAINPDFSGPISPFRLLSQKKSVMMEGRICNCIFHGRFCRCPALFPVHNAAASG